MPGRDPFLRAAAFPLSNAFPPRFLAPAPASRIRSTYVRALQHRTLLALSCSSGKLPLALGSEDTAVSAPNWPFLGLAWLSGLLCLVREHACSPRMASARSRLSFSSAPWVPSSPPCRLPPNSLARLSSKMRLTQLPVVSPTGTKVLLCPTEYRFIRMQRGRGYPSCGHVCQGRCPEN